MQRLAPRQPDVCRNCGGAVRFRVRSSRPSADGRTRTVYLTCPSCGARAYRIDPQGSAYCSKPQRNRRKTP